MHKFFGTFFLVMCAASAAHAVELEQLWTLDGFSNPESVALGPDGETLYVSNVAGDASAMDGEGFISRATLNGEMLEVRWADGLNAPKGIAIEGGHLFVTDVNAIAEIDLASGAILSRTDVPGAVFLNDSVIAPDGSVLASDSGGSRIYRLEGGDVSTVAEGDWLGGANGLLFEDGRLLVSTMDTHGLYALEDGNAEPRLIADDLGEADGIAALGGEAYLVSEWPGRLFEVAPDGSVTTLLDSRDENIYLNDILLVGDVLLIPNWEPGTLTAYRVTE